MIVQATGKRFIMGNSFRLGDMLRLGLHNCVDACTEIVDRAQKELLVEKVRGLAFCFTLQYAGTYTSKL